MFGFQQSKIFIMRSINNKNITSFSNSVSPKFLSSASSNSLTSQKLQPCLSQIQSIPLEQISQQKQPFSALQNLYLLQQKIGMKMYELDNLNSQYFQKQEKLFFKTFINMMDRMSTELSEAKVKYDHIDEEIDREKQCVELRAKLGFFKDQCIFLNGELKKHETELSQLRNKNMKNQETNQSLRNKLQKQIKKQKKYQYRYRKCSLQTKIDRSFTQSSARNRTPVLRQKSTQSHLLNNKNEINQQNLFVIPQNNLKFLNPKNLNQRQPQPIQNVDKYMLNLNKNQRTANLTKRTYATTKNSQKKHSNTINTFIKQIGEYNIEAQVHISDLPSSRKLPYQKTNKY